MSELLGHTVLRAVGKHFREHPDSWTTGPGTLFDRMENGEKLVELQPDDTGCIHTMISYYGMMYGGKPAIDHAIKLVCGHHGLDMTKESIFLFNDQLCGYVGRAIKFVEAPLPKKPGRAPRPNNVKTTTSKLQRVVAVVALIIAVILTSIPTT